jgi:hypothetical protein
MKFVLNKPVAFEESLTCEFKEVKSQPLHVVGKTVDEYMVAFLNEAGGSIYWGIRNADRVVTGFVATDKMRDELRQVIGQKVSGIVPRVSSALWDAPFHGVRNETGVLVPHTCVLEVRVAKPEVPGLFLTGAGDAYRKTLGGTKKLSGAELFMAIAPPLEAKQAKPRTPSVLARFPALYRRFQAVEPLVRGKRVLWVDDRPSNNFYERLALSQMGLMVDVATTSDEGLHAAVCLHPDVIVSDMERNWRTGCRPAVFSIDPGGGHQYPLYFLHWRSHRSARNSRWCFRDY